MKKGILALTFVAAWTSGFGQEEEEVVRDTTRVNLKKMEILIIEGSNSDDTIKIDPSEVRKNKAHWAGLDFGFNIMMNSSFQTDFPGEPHLKNDIAKSQVWNLNILEHKFKIAKEYFGLTTGLGFNFTQIGLRNNYVISDSMNVLVAEVDTVNSYKKNKLRATYITVPLLLEFNTNKNNDKGFYLATGIVGGYRIASTYKQVYEVDGNKRKDKEKGGYNLNPFKLDLTARLGYGAFGAFVTYSLLPVFESGATVNAAYPLAAGLTLNF